MDEKRLKVGISLYTKC